MDLIDAMDLIDLIGSGLIPGADLGRCVATWAPRRRQQGVSEANLLRDSKTATTQRARATGKGREGVNNRSPGLGIVC